MHWVALRDRSSAGAGTPCHRQRLRGHDGRARARGRRLARADAGAGRLGDPRPPQLGARLRRDPADAYSMATPDRVLRGVSASGWARFECVGGPRLLRRRVAPLPGARLRARAGDRRRERGPLALRLRRARALLRAGRAPARVAGDDGGEPTAPRRSAGFPHPPAASAPTVPPHLGSRAPPGIPAVPAAARPQPRPRRRPAALRRLWHLRPLRVRGRREERPRDRRPARSCLRAGWSCVPARWRCGSGPSATGSRPSNASTATPARDRLRGALVRAGRGRARLSPPGPRLGPRVPQPGPPGDRAAPDPAPERHRGGALPAPDRPRPPVPQAGRHPRLLLRRSGRGGPSGKLGAIQQLPTPPPALVRAHLPPGSAAWSRRCSATSPGSSPWPRTSPARRMESYSIPPASTATACRNSWSATARVAATSRPAQGSSATRAASFPRPARSSTRLQEIRTFSHAVGTLRSGDDPRTAPVDRDGRFRGLDNLYVTDASVFPTGGRREPEPDDRGPRASHRRAPRGAGGPRPARGGPAADGAGRAQLREDDMRRLNLVFLGCGDVAAAHSRTLARYRDEVRCFYASRDAERAMEFERRFGGGGSFGSYAGGARRRPHGRGLRRHAAPPPPRADPRRPGPGQGRDRREAGFPACRRLRRRGAGAGPVGPARAGGRELLLQAPRDGPARGARVGGRGRAALRPGERVQEPGRRGLAGRPGLAGGGALSRAECTGSTSLRTSARTSSRCTATGRGRPTGRSAACSWWSSTRAARWERSATPGRPPRRCVDCSSRASAAPRARSCSSRTVAFVVIWGRSRRVILPGLRDLAGFDAMFRDFLAALRGEREPLMTLARAREDLALVEAAYKSRGRHGA